MEIKETVVIVEIPLFRNYVQIKQILVFGSIPSQLDVIRRLRRLKDESLDLYLSNKEKDQMQETVENIEKWPLIEQVTVCFVKIKGEIYSSTFKMSLREIY